MKKTGDDQKPRETAVAGAQLARGNGKLLTSTNEQGAFRAELAEPVTDEPETKEIMIMSPGFGTRVVRLNTVSPEHGPRRDHPKQRCEAHSASEPR